VQSAHPYAQQRDAGIRSARKRRTTKLVRDLTATRPLTREQKAAVVAAATSIPLAEDAR